MAMKVALLCTVVTLLQLEVTSVITSGWSEMCAGIQVIMEEPLSLPPWDCLPTNQPGPVGRSSIATFLVGCGQFEVVSYVIKCLLHCWHQVQRIHADVYCKVRMQHCGPLVTPLSVLIMYTSLDNILYIRRRQETEHAAPQHQMGTTIGNNSNG